MTEKQNLELQKQESNVLQTGEKRFLQAQLATKNCDADHERIAEALRLVMVKIGLRAANWPSAMEKVILIEHIVTNFPNNTVDEIKIAFDWAIDERLNLGIDGYNCYENFSCAYFSRIMKAYNKLASVVKKPEQRQLIEYKPEPEVNVNESYSEFLKTPFADRLKKIGIKL